MLPTDYIRRLRQIEVRARVISEQLMGGRIPSVFKGRGMDFADVREYVPGDDVRRIDWNVTARLRKPFIKRHVEERELVVMLLIDLSASGHFGTALGPDAPESKRELAAILAGALAFSAVRDGDRVGAIFFTDRVEKYIPPRKTRAHITRLLHALLFTTPKSSRTAIASGLNFLNNLFRRPTLAFVLSDFQETDDADWTRRLKATNQRHAVIALRLTDPRELELPNVGIALLEDAESGEVVEVDTGDPKVRDAWSAIANDRALELRATFRRSRVPELEVRTDQPWAQNLQRFLDVAAKRKIL